MSQRPTLLALTLMIAFAGEAAEEAPETVTLTLPAGDASTSHLCVVE